jgi:hypothetical protein
MHRGDAHTSDVFGHGKSIYSTGTDEFVLQVMNFEAGTYTSLRVNPTDIPYNYANNSMMVRETGINIDRPEVKYATASSVINWLTYDTTNMLPYQKIGGLYDYIRDTVEVTGDFWVTEGDETTCKGSAIGSNVTATVISLDYQVLYGGWSASTQFYSPYIYGDRVEALDYMQTPDIYLDHVYSKTVDTRINIHEDIYVYDNINTTGTITSGGTIETIMGFRKNGVTGSEAGNVYLYDTSGGYGVYSFSGGILVPAL